MIQKKADVLAGFYKSPESLNEGGAVDVLSGSRLWCNCGNRKGVVKSARIDLKINKDTSVWFSLPWPLWKVWVEFFNFPRGCLEIKY